MASSLLALAVDAISSEDECDAGETEFDEFVGDSNFEANIGQLSIVQNWPMLYRWIGAVLWRPIHVCKTMVGMLPVLSLSSTECLINLWLAPETHHFFKEFFIGFPIFWASFPSVSTFFRVFFEFFMGFQRFPVFDLGVSLLPRGFFP